VAHYNTILNQLLFHVPRHQFDRLVETHQADRYAKTFSTWNQLTVMLYAQSSGKESLREIEQGLETQESKTYHVGLAGPVRRTTLADANGRRKWEIFRGVFGELLTRCRSVTPKHKFRFKNPLYSIDSTVIGLCLSLFPWARYRTAKGGLKLHYQLDYAGHIPSLLVITEGRENDVSVAKKDIPIEPDSIYCFDRGYVDFGYFRRLENMGCTFVTRMKKNLSYRVTGQQECLKNRGVLMDATIERGQGEYVGKDCPLRLIRYYDQGERSDAGVPDQQHDVCSNDDCGDLQSPLADRSVFQVDQAEFKDQDVPWHDGKRGAKPDMGGDDLLLVVGLHQISNQIRPFAVLFAPGD
jgi:hypothetical protein